MKLNGDTCATNTMAPCSKSAPADLKEQCRTAFTPDVGTCDFKYVKIKANVHWDELGTYFALSDLV